MKYFIDTNVIIDLLDNKEEAKNKLREIALEDSEIFINRLVVLETLRTIHFRNKRIFKEALSKLNLFEKVDIKEEIYDNTIQFSRFCHSKGVKIKGKCEAIDFLHFMTAKYYGLKLVSFDNDMDRLQECYIEFISL